MAFESLLSRIQANDPSLVELDISSGTPDIPSNRAELVQRVVAALAANSHVKSLKLIFLGLTETDIAPLAELLKTRDFDRLLLEYNDLSGEILLPALAVRDALSVLSLSSSKHLTALEHLSALSSLKELNLSSCGLSAVSLAVLQMPNLETLTLDGNPLKTLPDSFAFLSTLKNLDVSRCEFSEFPAVLLSRTQLEKLDITRNQITGIPDGVSALVHLNSFVAHNCAFGEFPVAITKLVRLEELKLSRNKGITRVPAAIGNLRSLKVLELSQCELTAVPAAVWTLTDLETLDLSWNPLRLLPCAMGAMSKLQRLSLGFGLVGATTHDGTLVTFSELAALVCVSNDPMEIGVLKMFFEEMTREDPLRLLRIANTHFAPRTPLRALCVSKCVAHGSSLELARLPAHIRDEIVRAAGVVEEQ